jgi:hypothetical protein
MEPGLRTEPWTGMATGVDIEIGVEMVTGLEPGTG